jgi:hypothetical protein
MKIPWRARFGIRFKREGKGFYVRILMGFPMIYLAWNAKNWDAMYADETYKEIAIGWIPLNAAAGCTIPAWKPYSQSRPVLQQVKG